MALFISKNGKQLGPYSVAEAQTLLRSGKLVDTDWAWQEGMVNWIPLKQLPGFAAVTSAKPPVPPVPVVPVEVLPPTTKAKSPSRAGIGGMAVAAGAVLLKFIGPFLIFFKTGASMLLSIVAYWWAFHWTWQMATGIVFLIFVHEMGHVIAAKLLGVPVTAPLFIPFLGASITMKQNPRDAWTEALMAYGGPLAGCIGSWICWALALYLHEPWMMVVASISFLINLFNMIPIPPLDGGRICSAVSSWFWLIGLVLLFASVVYFHAWNSIVIIVLVLLAAIPRMKQTLFGQLTEEMKQYYRVHIGDRLTMALMYLGLIAALLLGYWSAHTQMLLMMY
jgi:Zn-dependent protease